MKWARGAVGGTHRLGAEGTDRAQRARDLIAKWYETLMISQRARARCNGRATSGFARNADVFVGGSGRSTMLSQVVVVCACSHARRAKLLCPYSRPLGRAYVFVKNP